MTPLAITRGLPSTYTDALVPLQRNATLDTSHHFFGASYSAGRKLLAQQIIPFTLSAQEYRSCLHLCKKYTLHYNDSMALATRRSFATSPPRTEAKKKSGSASPFDLKKLGATPTVRVVIYSALGVAAIAETAFWGSWARAKMFGSEDAAASHGDNEVR